MARGRKPKFNKKLILSIIANYFYDHRNENLSVYSLETVYADIIAKASESLRYKNVAFPGYEHIRKILIDTLSKNKLFQKEERMTTTAASRIVQLYNHFSDADEIEIIISEQYTISIYDNPVITCKVKLPLKEALDALAGNMLNTKKKITSWDRFNMISRLYRFIKRKNADVILAIIPQYNKLYYLDSDGKINRNRKITDSVYDTPLIFIKDTPEGRNFLKEQIIP